MINVTAQELETILTTLDKALIFHDQWREQLQRALICKPPPEDANLAPVAHRHCAFGHWYYSPANAQLRKLETFRHVEEIHEAMHPTWAGSCAPRPRGTGPSRPRNTPPSSPR